MLLNQNLATRLAVYTILLAFLTGTLVSAVTIYINYSRTITELEETAAQLLELTLDSATAAVFQLDPALADNVLSGLMQYPLFVQVSVFDELGEELATLDRPGQSSSGLVEFLDVPNLEMSYELPLGGETNQSGMLTAVLDLNPGLSSFYDQALLTAGAQILLAVTLAAVISLVVVYLITRPLSELARALADTEPGSEKKLTIEGLHSNDELGNLTDSVNKYLSAAFEYQEELEQSGQRLQSILDNLREGVLVVDSNGIISECNRAAEQMFGYDSDGAIGVPIVALVQESGFRDFDELLFEASRYSQAGLRCQATRVDGKNFLVETAVARFNTPGMDSTLWTIRDLSEQEEMERQRRELEEQLRQSQKMEAIGTLAGGIAHDFNNILAGINGYSELVLLNAEQGKSIKENVNQIMRASTKASQLVQRILTFSRKQKEYRHLFNLADVAQECVDLIKQAIPASINVDADLGDRKFPVFGDESMMHQILMNMFANSAGAMRNNPGEIRLSLKVVNSSLVPKTTGRPAAMARIIVDDTGPGIPENILPRIFEPYFTTKSPGEGTGIGLAMVHSIVDNHGGRISAENRVVDNEIAGARFTIDLPLYSGEETPMISEQENESGTAAGSGMILLVEDNEMLAEMFPELLGSLGFEVELARDGEEGLAMYKEQLGKYDLVITDQTMPKMNGDRLVRAIFDINPEQPIILCTGYSDVVDKEKVLAMGVKCFLNKPLTLEEISKGIQEALS